VPELDPIVSTKLVAVNASLAASGLPYAFGGAIALGYCIADPRGTHDLDVNVFVRPTEASSVLEAFPEGVERDERDLEVLGRDGQVRLRWGDTPVDIFLANHPFHDGVAGQVRVVPFGDGDIRIPVLPCAALAVFKTFFARPKDFVDIANMVEVDSLDAEAVRATISSLLGSDAPELAQFDAAVADGRRLDRNEPKRGFGQLP
jgi:hypothetical protein